MRGIYIGKEEQFKDRTADLTETAIGIVSAQFDTGKLWETHSRLLFLLTDWIILDE